MSTAEPAPHLVVVRPGLLTTVQDLGRQGWQRIGVPRSGAADTEGLRLANWLAGNPGDSATLEITHSGPVLHVAATAVRIAIAGADCEVSIDDDPRVAETGPWRATTLHRGARLSIGRVRAGLRCYVAVFGGFALEPVLDSLSTYTRAALGPFEGRALAAGDRMPLNLDEPPPEIDARIEPPAWWWEGGPLRAVLGPHADRLTSHGAATLFGVEYTVSPQSDRTGLRLVGPAVERTEGEIDSTGCVHGSIQLPGAGLPIVLGPDSGTTGGYPAVATVIGADLPRLGRMRPGDRMHLASVSVKEAEHARREREAHLAELAGKIRPA